MYYLGIYQTANLSLIGGKTEQFFSAALWQSHVH